MNRAIDSQPRPLMDAIQVVASRIAELNELADRLENVLEPVMNAPMPSAPGKPEPPHEAASQAIDNLREIAGKLEALIVRQSSLIGRLQV